MIKKIHIENFKPFSTAEIDVAPLTILFGPNGSGKSSVLQALAVLSQSSRPRWAQHAELDLGGPLISYRYKDWAYHMRDTSLQLGLGTEIDLDSSLLEGITLEVVKKETKSATTTLAYRYAFSEVERSFSQELKLGGTVLFASETRRISKGRWENSWNHGTDFPITNLPEPVRRIRFNDFLSPDSFRGAFLGTNEYQKNSDFAQLVNLCIFLLEEMRRTLYETIFLVTAQRDAIFPLKKELREAIENDDRSRSVGTKGENAVNTMTLLAGPAGDQAAVGRITGWLAKFGLPVFIAGLASQAGSGSSIEASFIDPDLGVRLSLPMAGYGSVQMVPVIAQLFCAPAGSTVMIEEPEISLHPGAQVLLPELFIDAVKQGRQVIVSTHSQTLVTALRHAVRKKMVSSAEIALYDMTKGASGTTARKVTMSEDGVLAEWIPSFAEVEDKMFEEWQEEEE